MKIKKYILILILLSISINVVSAAGSINTNTTLFFNPSINYSEQTNQTTDLFKSEENGNSNNGSNYDIGSDMVAVGLVDKTPRMLGDSLFEQVGGVRAWIAKFYTWNIKPWDIPGVKEVYNNVWYLVFPLIVLFMMGATIAKNAAISNPQACTDVFGNIDWAYRDTVGGGLFMIIGAFFGSLFYLIMLILDVVNAALLMLVMESIEPSIDNAVMYCALAIITILLFCFFVYRQMWIVAGYVFSPFYGVLFASGCLKSFVDSIGEAFLRAMLMQPMSIGITVLWIIVIKAISLEMWGTTVWEANDSGLPYLVLFIVLLAGCIWCVFGKFTLITRPAKMIIKRRMF